MFVDLSRPWLLLVLGLTQHSQAKPSAAKRSCRQRNPLYRHPFVRRESILTSQRQPDNHRHFDSLCFKPSILQSWNNLLSVLLAAKSLGFLLHSKDGLSIIAPRPPPTAHGAQGHHRVSETLNRTTRFRSSSWLLPLTTSPTTFQSTSRVDTQLPCVDCSHLLPSNIHHEPPSRSEHRDGNTKLLCLAHSASCQ